MAIKTKIIDKSVVESSIDRIINLNNSAKKIYVNTSGGKDSIVLMNLYYELLREGKLDPTKMEINFIDEEAMFEDVIEIVKEWRLKFIEEGVKFNWFCIEAKHFNCLNQLSNDESFIMWDTTKKDNWVRKMPDFAIKDHPLLNRRKENYQNFLDKFTADGIKVIGLRVKESIHRLISMAVIMGNKDNVGGLSKELSFYPIYDWEDGDVWKYIKEKNLNFPNTYLNLYQINTQRNKLRISQFFSIDTVKVLVRLNEYEPGLMDRVIKREPNAYLAALYWDSEMFRRAKSYTKTETKENFKKKTFLLIKEKIKSSDETTVKFAKDIRKMITTHLAYMKDRDWKKAYEILYSGDPKYREQRGFIARIIRNKKVAI